MSLTLPIHKKGIIIFMYAYWASALSQQSLGDGGTTVDNVDNVCTLLSFPSDVMKFKFNDEGEII